ncbi:hypothetical protein X777_09756 [Ooceraea biroi]|uniref:Uncharacterized protein n=1 Tax=Ooceraea biroi TaxID=2015173 RepID=A0A026W647_OOCBI|nr:hypothetical protein X777_09756 [Ooceraea biroi]
MAVDLPDRNFNSIRDQVAQRIEQSQQRQKIDYDRRRKTPRQYKKGDLIMIRNFKSTPSISRKLIPQFRGPYEIVKVLRNDRYVIADPPDVQNTQQPYTGVWDVNNIRPWVDSDTFTS